MLKRIKKLLERNAFALAIILTIIIAFLSLSKIPKINLGVHIKSSDKYFHTIAYFVLSLVWLFTFRNKLKKTLLLVIFFLLILYGIILEVLQGTFTNYRTADFYDIIANSIGIILATVFFKKFINWFNSI